ncbi:hypothetical protein bcgnr5385_39530 [Bacillus cereus]
MEFTISRAYEGLSKVECQDLLEAVQVTYNIEGDLYYRGELIVSCMGYSGMRNRKNLGIRILWWKRAYIPPFSNFLISVEKSTP